MSHLNEILERLAQIQMTINLPDIGMVQAAYPYMPADPSSAQCPFFVNEVRGGPIKVFAVTGAIHVTDLISMSLCVARIESDATQAAVLQNVAFYRDVVISTMMGKIRLGNDLSFILDSALSSWDGISVIDYGSTRFGGMTFELAVRELYGVTVSA